MTDNVIIGDEELDELAAECLGILEQLHQVETQVIDEIPGEPENGLAHAITYQHIVTITKQDLARHNMDSDDFMAGMNYAPDVFQSEVASHVDEAGFVSDFKVSVEDGNVIFDFIRTVEY